MPQPSRRLARPILALTLIFAALLALAAVLGGKGTTEAGQIVQCTSPTLQANATINWTPHNSGAQSSDLQVDLLDTQETPDTATHLAEAFLADTTADLNLGHFIGSATIAANGTSATINGHVPNIADGTYDVFVCWEYRPVTGGPPAWHYQNARDFTVTSATASPTPSPTPTPTPAPTHTPTPTPSPSGPPFKYFPLNVGPLLNYVAPFTVLDDLSIFGIEVTQGIQCFNTSQGLSGCPDNSLPLVAQKDTTARIYLKYGGSAGSKAGVPVRLHLFANGQEYIVNTFGRARKTLDQSVTDNANVWFNVNFVNGTDVSFYAEVDPNNTYAELNENNNRFPSSGTFTLHFYKRTTFDVVGWRMWYHPSGASDAGVAGGWGVNSGGPNWLNLVWPVKNGGIHYSIHSGYLNWTSANPTSGDVVNLAKFLSVLANIFPWTDPEISGADRVHVWSPSAHFIRGLSDPPFSGGLGVASVGDDSFNAGMSLDSPGFGPVNFVHELSHNTGEHHTATGQGCDTSADGGTDWPYSNPKIQEFGYNPDSGYVYNPSNTYDYMSYCYGGGATTWVSPFHWTQQFNIEGSSFGPVVSADAGPAANNADLLAVSATLDNPDLNGDTGGSLGTMYKTDGGGNPAPSPSGSGYSVQLRDGDAVLGTQSFGVSFVPLETDGVSEVDGNSDLASMDVAFTMPWVDGATSIVLLRGAQVLDTVAVSGHAPTVQVTSPSSHESWNASSTHTLSWTSSDSDGDTLTYAVFYAHDGQDWEVLAEGITGTTFDVDVDTLGGGDDAVFRVVATDGVNTGYGDSATVSIPAKPPLVAITAPSDGEVVQEGELVVLQGVATDLEDGQLGDESLHWTSDQDGDLGTGAVLPTNTLSAGQHTITLTATDSDGMSSSQSLTLIVGVRGQLDVRPKAIDPNTSDDVTAIVTLVPGLPPTDINLSSLHLHIGSADLTPTGTSQLGDTDTDGLPELRLTFDGAALRAALTTPRVLTDVLLTGSMNGGAAFAAGGQVALVAPGDVDCSGATTAGDLVAALGYAANISLPDCLFAGDFTCDGLVTPLDVIGILGQMAGVTNSAANCNTASPASVARFQPAPDRGSHGFSLSDLSPAAWLLPVTLPALVAVRPGRRK